MTVESRQPNFFSPQHIWDIELMNPSNICFNKNAQFGSCSPSSGPTTETEPILQPKFADSLSHVSLYNVPLSNKRPRGDSNLIGRFAYSSSTNNVQSQESWVSSLFHQIQQQQLDSNRIISEHMEKVRMELAEKTKIRTKRMIEAIEITVSKKLKTKDEELEKMKKLNWFLGEKAKSLNTENQLWREIAQNNEAAANTLRINLEQVLAQRSRAAIENNEDIVSPIPPVIDDAYSCCDSNHESEGNVVESTKKTTNTRDNGYRLCRNCGKDESCVLILPCRHLCLCVVCEITLDACPTCKSHITNSIHINV